MSGAGGAVCDACHPTSGPADQLGAGGLRGCNIGQQQGRKHGDRKSEGKRRAASRQRNGGGGSGGGGGKRVTKRGACPGRASHE